MNYEIGMELAYLGRSLIRIPYENWIISRLVRMTKTQGVLENGTRFQLEDGRIIGRDACFSEYVKSPSDPRVAQRIEEARRAKEAYEYRNTQLRRVHAGLDKIKPGNYQRMSADQLKVIADAIEQAIAMGDE